MHVIVKFNIDNQAFVDDMRLELRTVLEDAYEKLASGDADYHPLTLMDSNGNTIGTCSIEEEDDEVTN